MCNFFLSYKINNYKDNYKKEYIFDKINVTTSLLNIVNIEFYTKRRREYIFPEQYGYTLLGNQKSFGD